MKISWLILTYNRSDTVNLAFNHNWNNSGVSVKDTEIIWVDNGSLNLEKFHKLQSLADVKIFNKMNLGVAKGYNRGLALATGDYIVITGCDRLMPENWLGNYIKYFDAIPNTGIISTYSQPIEKVPERYRTPDKKTETIKGLPIIRAMPMEAKILSRVLHREIGYLKEDLGLYGWEDVLWGERAEKVCKKKGLMSYIIPGKVAKHLGDEGIANWSGSDDEDYHAFKKRESADPKKREVIEKYRQNSHPYYNPYV